MNIDWATVAYAATAAGSAATAIGVVIMTWQIREARAIAQSTFEDSFDQQYRSLAKAIPVDALIGKPVATDKKSLTRENIYNYLDVSNEQVYLRKQNRIRKSTWDDWAKGIKSHMSKIEFSEVWNEVNEHAPDTFTFLARLTKDDFKSDPKSWK